MRYDPAISLFNELTIGHRAPCLLAFDHGGNYKLVVNIVEMTVSQIQLIISVIERRAIEFIAEDDYISVG